MTMFTSPVAGLQIVASLTLRLVLSPGMTVTKAVPVADVAAQVKLSSALTNV